MVFYSGNYENWNIKIIKLYEGLSLWQSYNKDSGFYRFLEIYNFPLQLFNLIICHTYWTTNKSIAFLNRVTVVRFEAVKGKPKYKTLCSNRTSFLVYCLFQMYKKSIMGLIFSFKIFKFNLLAMFSRNIYIIFII